MLFGGGVAMALPFLESMGMAKAVAGKELPKRMMVGYIAYGTYMPNGSNGLPGDRNKPHHDWSWWPCAKPGELTFNKSSKPFEPLKDYVTYLQGLDHKGGWSMGGHDTGDRFVPFPGPVNNKPLVQLDRIKPILVQVPQR